MQSNLTWNSITFCTPSNGMDGYLSTPNIKRVEIIEKNIPGSAGRYQRIVGTALNDKTAYSISFQCEKTVDNIGDIQSFYTSVENVTSDPNRTTGTLSYSILNDSSAISKSYMSLDEFAPKSIEYANSKYIIVFSLKFSQWGN